MKKIISIVLSLVMMLSFVGCGQKAAAGWQEQYDLGIKYVNEAKYEEAILAFTKALEIDPKQADIYLRMADAYILSGNTSEAIIILNKGLENTNSTQISEKIDDLSENTLREDDTFKQRECYDDFTQLNPKLQAELKKIFEIAVQYDENQLIEFGTSTDLMDADIFEEYGIKKNENNLNGTVYTVYQGNKVKLSINRLGYNKYIGIEIRPENGTGYCSVLGYYLDNAGEYIFNVLYIAKCNCEVWQFNGTMYNKSLNKYTGEWSISNTETGPIENNMRHGIYVLEDSPTDDVTVIPYATSFEYGIATDVNTELLPRDVLVWGDISSVLPMYNYSLAEKDKVREEMLKQLTW